MSLLYCIFSVGLMFYYDLKLGAIALLLTLVRAVAIIGSSAIRIYFENKHFNLQGRTGGLVLQLIAGVGKLRVANATGRALALWSRRFRGAEGLLHRVPAGRQRAGRVRNGYPTIATLIIFALAAYFDSKLLARSRRVSRFNTAFARPWARSEPGRERQRIPRCHSASDPPEAADFVDGRNSR